jgi:hypothetical protein
MTQLGAIGVPGLTAGMAELQMNGARPMAALGEE